MLLPCLLAGCGTVPMTYAEWKDLQEEKLRFARAGVPYKSTSQLLAEAAEMRRIAQDTMFPIARK